MIKVLMVHLDGSKGDDLRLAHAEALSASFDQARISGLFTNPLPEYAYVLGVQSGYGDIGPIVELEQQLRREGDRVVARIEQRLLRPGATHDVRRIDAWASAIPDLVVSQARCADLFVATTPYRDAALSSWDTLVEAVLFQGGHGLFLVPEDCAVRTSLNNLLVAWNDTTASTRGIAQALPFLRRAGRVRLLSIHSGNGDAGVTAADAAAYLDRHDVAVEILDVEAEEEDAGAIIRDEATKMAADAIVMGAYGHSRFREWVLGGATRDVVRHAQIPLILAH